MLQIHKWHSFDYAVADVILDSSPYGKGSDTEVRNQAGQPHHARGRKSICKYVDNNKERLRASISF